MRPPDSRAADATRSAPRPAITTCAPAAATSFAAASPAPEPPPNTTIFLPSSMVIVLSRSAALLHDEGELATLTTDGGQVDPEDRQVLEHRRVAQRARVDRTELGLRGHVGEQRLGGRIV